MDIAAMPREFPQFGKSVSSLFRTVLDQPNATSANTRSWSSLGLQPARARVASAAYARSGEPDVGSSADGLRMARAHDVARDRLLGGSDHAAVCGACGCDCERGTPSTRRVLPREMCRGWSEVMLTAQSTPVGASGKLCGGDVTEEMAWFMQYAADQQPDHRWLRRALSSALNWKDADKQRPEWKCNVGCPGTLSICGMCFSSSAPANIMYGYLVLNWGGPLLGTEHGALAYAEGVASADGRRWPEHDRAAVEMGFAVFRATEGPSWTGAEIEKALCASVEAGFTSLQPPDDPECMFATPCYMKRPLWCI